MKPEELLAKCDEQLALAGENAKISLVLSGSYGTGKKRLCTGGPMGTVVSEQQNKQVLVFFDAQEVKTFVQKSLAQPVR